MTIHASEKCFSHDFLDAEGHCVHCGNPFCSGCLTSVNGHPRCWRCQNKKVSPPPIPVWARPKPRPSLLTDLKIRVSLLILVAGASISLVSTPLHEIGRETLYSSVITGYMIWGLFWGLPPVWRWWRGSPFGLSSFTGCLMGAWFFSFLSLFFLLAGGWFYSLFGGGIYQFAKHWLRVNGRMEARA